MDHKTLVKKIADGFAGLSPQLQRAARYILDHPDDVALMSMRRLADAADVHPSSMVRLAQVFSFDSYLSFRQVFQNRLRVRPRDYVSRARDLQNLGGVDKQHRLISEMETTNADNLRETFARIGPEKMAAVADCLLHAKRLFIVGSRSTFLVAYFFDYALRMFRGDVMLLGGRGGTFGDSLRTLREGDVVLAIGFDPYSHDTVRATTYARDHGARTVVMTDSPVSPLVKGAEHVLLIHNESPAVFNSVSTVLGVAETLVGLMVQQGGEKALTAIRETEKQLQEFEVYWREGTKAATGSQTKRKRTKS